MELGEVFKEGGIILYDKLFYFHYRRLPNQLFFGDIDGCGITKPICEKHKDKIKEKKHSLCFDLKKQLDVLDEKTIVFNSQEIIVGNGYCLVYYYGEKRILEDEYLRKLAIEYSYKTDYNINL